MVMEVLVEDASFNVTDNGRWHRDWLNSWMALYWLMIGRPGGGGGGCCQFQSLW